MDFLSHFSFDRFLNRLSSLAGTSSSTNHTVPRFHCLASATASSSRRAIIILPGLGNNSSDYSKLSFLLQQRNNAHVEIPSISRLDWARNAAGLLDKNYWTGNLSPRPTVDWYLERIEAAVQSARTTLPDAPITLLAHSAGGWLGRLFLLDFDRSNIDRFVSLGSPHLPPPDGVIDQTRGILSMFFIFE